MGRPAVHDLLNERVGLECTRAATRSPATAASAASISRTVTVRPGSAASAPGPRPPPAWRLPSARRPPPCAARAHTSPAPARRGTRLPRPAAASRMMELAQVEAACSACRAAPRPSGSAAPARPHSPCGHSPAPEARRWPSACRRRSRVQHQRVRDRLRHRAAIDRDRACDTRRGGSGRLRGGGQHVHRALEVDGHAEVEILFRPGAHHRRHVEHRAPSPARWRRAPVPGRRYRR